MRKLLLACITICLWTNCSSTYSTVDKIAENRAARLVDIYKNFNKHPDYVFVNAHRAGWRFAPENSIEAIQYSIRQGVDIVEIDLKKTKDGKIIVLHDETLDRTTNGRGKVEDWTLDSLKTLFLVNGLGVITPYKIPTLEEALLAAKGKILVDLDKSYKYIREAYEIAKKTGTLDQVIFRVDDSYPLFFNKYGGIIKEINYMPLLWWNTENPEQFVKAYLDAEHRPTAIEVIMPNEQTPYLKLLPQIKNAHIRIMMNPCMPHISANHDDERALNQPDDAWGWLIDKGATILGTDRPDLLRAYLKEKHFH